MSEWNEWREINPKNKIELQGAIFYKTYLVGVNLRGAHLEGADFTGANLENADFTGAWLNRAEFEDSILSKQTIFNKAKLPKSTWSEGVDLQGLNFKDAEFQGANLSFANFQGANVCGAHFEEATLIGANFKSMPDEKIYTKLRTVHFNGAMLTGATFDNNYLYNIYFEQANNGKQTILKMAQFCNSRIENSTNFKNADMVRVVITNSIISGVDFEGADLSYATLEGASIGGYRDIKTNLKSSNLTGATVNGRTKIQDCDIDENTNFTMVGLDSAEIEPSLLAALKTNIRRITWNKYYDEEGKSLWGKIKIAPIRLFWWLSDYGSNTVRIFNIFLGVSVIFTLIYLAIAYLNPDPAAVLSNLKITGNWWLNVISAFCFAVSTMVTLGFGGINVTIQESAPWATFFALFFVTFNLMIGYFILAVLVTRLGILFQSLAPEQKIDRS